MNYQNDLLRSNLRPIESDNLVQFSMNLSPVQCVLLSSFVDSTIRYVLDGSLMESIMEDNKSDMSSRNIAQPFEQKQKMVSPGEADAAPILFTANIALQNPLIVMRDLRPRSSYIFRFRRNRHREQMHHERI